MSVRIPAILLLLLSTLTTQARAACCYFSAKDKDIAQPGQKAFITWDPAKKLESFTVQPKFEGNAADFGMVIPTPNQPRLDEMPRDFFKALAVFTILKNREYPSSKFVGGGFGGLAGGLGGGGFGGLGGGLGGLGGPQGLPRRPPVVVLEAGVVGTLEYKIIRAERADELYDWLKQNKYRYAGDEATLDHYVKKDWIFTVMKIDTMQLTRKSDGTFAGEISPVRFQFTSEKLIYPLKITALSVKEKTEALFYVQAPHKVDLPGDLTYQYQWVPMLQNAQGLYPKGTFGRDDLPGKGTQLLFQIQGKLSDLNKRAEELGYGFQSGKRPAPNKDGRIAATLEWAKKLTADDIKILRGEAPYTDKLPDIDAGFSALDFRDAQRAAASRKILEARLERSRKERPGGYLIREAPPKDIQDLKLLNGILQQGQFLTKFRKTFTKAEMDDDVLLVPAQVGRAVDVTEYEEILPSSPP
jgi:hypothetical protein